MAYTMDDIKRMRQEYAASGKMASQMDMKPVENPKYSMEDIQKMRVAITGESAPRQQIPSIADTQKSKRSGTSSKRRSAASSANSSNPAEHSKVKVTYKKKGNLEVGGTYNGYAVQAMGKKRGIKYSDLHPENSARIPSIEDYQKQHNTRSKTTDTSQKTTENKDLEKKDSKLPVLVTPQAKSNVTQKTKVKRASSYLEGGSSNSGSPYAAAKQNTGTKKNAAAVRQDILMPDNATAEESQSVISAWSDPDYKMSSSEKKAAQEYIDNYYKTANGFSGQSSLNPITRIKAGIENAKIRENWTPKEQAQYETVVSLENKLSKGAAFMSSFANATGAVDAAEQIGENVAKSFTGNETEIPSLETLAQGTKNQNPGSAFAGTMAGQAAKYAFTKQLLGQIPGYDGLNQKLSEQFGKIPILGQFGDNLANIAADTTVDLAADTLPQIAQNVQSGMSASEVAKEAGKNIAGNVAWNVVGEGVGEGLKRLPTLSDLVRKGQNVAKQELPMLGNMGELSAADIADLTEQAAKSANDVANVAKQGAESVTAASRSVSDILSSDATNKEIDNIIGDPTLRTEFEQITGKRLTGSKADMRSAVKLEIGDKAAENARKNTVQATGSAVDSGVNASANTVGKQVAENTAKTGVDVQIDNKNVSEMQIQNIINDVNLQKEFTKRTGVKLTGTREQMAQTIQENISDSFGAREIAAMDKANAGQIANAMRMRRQANLDSAKQATVNGLQSDIAKYNMSDTTKTDVAQKIDEIKNLMSQVNSSGDSTDVYEQLIGKVGELDKLLKNGATQTVTDEFNTKAYNDVVSYLRGTGKSIYVSPEAAAEFPDGIKALNNQFASYGKGITFTTDASKGVSLDSIIEDMSGMTGFKSTGNDIDDLKKLTEYLARTKAGRTAQIPYDGSIAYDFVDKATKAFDDAMDMANRTSAGKELKVSKARTNTLANSGLNTETELARYMKQEDFRYLTVSEKESMEEAARRVAINSDGWKSKLLGQDELSGKDTDTLMMIYKNTVEKARQTGDEGLWSEASDIFKKIQTQSTKSGQQVQALAKWSRSTPEGALMEASRTVANAVDKVHGKGYSSAMDNVAEQVADAVKNSKSTEEAAKRVESLLNMNLQFFAKDGKAPNIKIKGKDKVLEAVRNGAGWRDVMDIIRQQNNVGYISVRDQKQIYEYLDEAKNYAKDSREAKELIAKAAKIVADKTPQTIGSQVKSVLYDNMLGIFKTAVSRNAFGNLGYNVLEQSRQPLAATIDRLVSLGTGKRTTTGWNAEKAAAYLGGLKKGVVDEAKDIKAGVNTTRSGFDAFADAVNQNRKAFNGTGKLSDIANGIDSIVDHGMSLGDRPFYEANYAQAKTELQQIIKRYGKDTLANANGQDIEAVIDSAAKVQALQSVFQDSGPIADALTGFRDSIGKFSEGVAGIDILSMASSPFVKTPGNMLSRAVEYSPFGVVKNVVGTGGELAKGSFNQRRFVDETSRNLMGTALLGGAYAAAQSGLTTGSYSDDYDEAQAQRDAGMLEYAIQLPNGLQVDAGDIPALGPLIEAGAKMKESGNPVDGSLQALGAIAAGSTMQGMNRLFGSDSGFSTDGPDLISNAKNTLLSSGTQLVPSLVRQTAQTTDPYKRDMGEYGTLDYYKNLVKNQIPGLRQTLPIKYNEEGLPVLQNQGRDIGSKILENYFLPMNMSEYQPSTLTREASRLFEATGENIAFNPKASRSEAKKLLGSDYSEDAYQQYKQELGAMKSEAGNALMQSDAYQNMTDDEKVKALQDAYSAMKAAKKAEITGEDTTQKLAQAYQEKGTQGMLDYMALDNASRSQFTSSDGTAKTFASANASEKLKVMEQQGMSTEEMGKYLYSDNMAKGAQKAQEVRGYEGIYDYYKIKSEADADGNGSLKQDELIPYLENKEYDEETKQLYFSLFFPKAKKNPFSGS